MYITWGNASWKMGLLVRDVVVRDNSYSKINDDNMVTSLFQEFTCTSRHEHTIQTSFSRYENIIWIIGHNHKVLAVMDDVNDIFGS